MSQNNTIGYFENHLDIGKVKIPGTVTYNDQDQEYLIEGSGTNIWFGNDEFHFLFKKLSGDFILTAQIEFIGKGVDPHRKTGWMVRKSEDSNSPHISALIHGDGLTSLQFRKIEGGDMEEIRSEKTSVDVVQLERTGKTYKMDVARFGEPFTSVEITDSTLGDEVLAGLFVCSHNPDVSEKVNFKNVRIILPAKAGFVPYKDYIGSNLEIMDMETYSRKIIFTAPNSFQAPNWTPDGKTLIYNSEGLLFNFDLASGSPSVLPTGFATSNNNDHVLSFDGKMIGISHHSREDDGKSIIYVLPVTGGDPAKVTSKGPSYLHSWSPDGKYLIYTAGRNNRYNIYKIPVSGGEEIQLTNFEGLDDGPEYTPDGNYIYFNSTRSGLMQIWRMKPDGSSQEQITSDNFNNWFPHISPDGKWIVFLSYLNDIDPATHPFYRHVYIRLIPVGGGQPKVIAYLYGGQGTINVPSWSPDSKKIAFVSNTVYK